MLSIWQQKLTHQLSFFKKVYFWPCRWKLKLLPSGSCGKGIDSPTSPLSCHPEQQSKASPGFKVHLGAVTWNLKLWKSTLSLDDSGPGLVIHVRLWIWVKEMNMSKFMMYKFRWNLQLTGKCWSWFLLDRVKVLPFEWDYQKNKAVCSVNVIFPVVEPKLFQDAKFSSTIKPSISTLCLPVQCSLLWLQV